MFALSLVNSQLQLTHGKRRVEKNFCDHFKVPFDDCATLAPSWHQEAIAQHVNPTPPV
jgi:hypothetical protein